MYEGVTIHLKVCCLVRKLRLAGVIYSPKTEIESGPINNIRAISENCGATFYLCCYGYNNAIYSLGAEISMSNETHYKNNPLHGVGLKSLLIEMVDQYGFELLFAYLNINCFKSNPSIDSSVKFLKKTAWAREKVEAFYLYEFKNLPRASSRQFLLPPRERIIPEDQAPGNPKALSLEDAERLREKRANKSAAQKQWQGRARERVSIHGEAEK